MHLSDKEITAIRESLKWLMPEVDRVSGEFYKDLFRRDPKLRGMFRDDLEGQGMRFMTAISVIVDNLDNPERLDREVALLAKGHGAFHIRKMDYHTMEEALIDTFRYALGARFTRDMQLAWRSAFQQISAAMMSETDASG